MWAELASFLQANATETLVISIIGTLLVWMYKQFKGMIDREQQDKLKTIQSKQAWFTKLELSLASVFHLRDEESKRRLLTLLGECGPYLTRMQRTVVRDYCKSFDPGVLYTLQELTIHEVDQLERQLEKLGEGKEAGEWLYYIQRLYAPVWPIILFACVAFYIVFVFALIGQGPTLWIKINVLLSGITFFISVVFVLNAITSLAKGEMGKQGAKRWAAFVVMMCSPSLIFVIGRWEMSLISIALQAAAIVFLSFNKRPPEIIRLA